MKKLVFKIILFTLPLIICLVFFLLDDPFSVVYREDGLAEKSTDIFSAKKFIATAKTQNFNTFLFGNSRVNSLDRDDLSKRLEKDANIFYFNAPGDCILNYYKKMCLIKKYNCKIKTAILLVDEGIIANTDNKSNLFKGPVYDHSVYTSDINYFEFYSKYIEYYFTDFFFAKHIYYILTKNYKPWMIGAFQKPNLNSKRSSLKIINVDKLKDSLLQTNFIEYKKQYKPAYTRFFNVKLDVKEISESDLKYLKEIHAIFLKEKTDYYIFIPPAFSQKKFNENILKQLTQIFGNRIYDFSGENKLTSDSTLHYEQTHFSNKAGRIILDSLFNKN